MLDLFKKRVDNLAEQIEITSQEASAHEDEGDYVESMEYLWNKIKEAMANCR